MGNHATVPLITASLGSMDIDKAEVDFRDTNGNRLKYQRKEGIGLRASILGGCPGKEL